jgi:hypothetical protein
MLIAKVPRDVLIIAVLILASSASFGLGYLAGLDAPVPNVDCALSQSIGDASTTVTSAAGRYVASKNGTKYYLPSCTGVEKISEANKVWFASVATAKAAGYTPAANCAGL